ncbi:MAG: hypothetical protein WC471_01325 [Candidatus Woesearchaeota archaeon]
MNRKAFIFTLDALFALLLAMTFFAYIFTYMGHSANSFNNIDLLNMVDDSLNALEKSSALSNAVKSGSTASILAYINAMPTQICARVSLYSSSETLLYSVSGTGCGTLPSDYNTGRRIFVVNNVANLAVMEVWYR